MHRAGYHRRESVEFHVSTYNMDRSDLSNTKLNNAYRASAVSVVELKYVEFEATICRLKHKHPPTHVGGIEVPLLITPPGLRRRHALV
jgi:hypothetical protein